MQYLFSKQVMDKLDGLDEDTRRYLFGHIMALPEFGEVKALEGRHSGQYRLRIRDWRIIYKVDGDDEDVIKIGYILLPRKAEEKAPTDGGISTMKEAVSTKKTDKADDKAKADQSTKESTKKDIEKAKGNVRKKTANKTKLGISQSIGKLLKKNAVKVKSSRIEKAKNAAKGKDKRKG